MVSMGCFPSAQRVVSVPAIPWPDGKSKGETVVAALKRLDDEIARSERSHPTARLAVVTNELDSIQQEIKSFEEITTSTPSPSDKDAYAKTIHQMFISLDLYRRPVLASENEDFVANVNRKEMRRIELSWLKTRFTELQRERRVLHAQILRNRSLYAQQQELLDSIWSKRSHPGSALEGALGKASALRDALASVSARLRAAAECAHAAVRVMDDALPAWKLTAVGKSGWERTAACADACRLLVEARCLERGARRALCAPAAPRAARALRLALDYAFTDALHDHKYQRATEIFMEFKDALVQLINSIHQKRSQGKAKTVDIYINGKQVSVPSYFTIMQALRSERVTIPSFCYHERLSIAGNCRMCLVQVEGMFKPQIACAMPVAKNMRIRTNSPATAIAQEGVLEFLLINHPLDCPICDQGGECDLQDLTVRFGNDRSRFTEIHFEGKRAQEDKDMGPLIRAEMSRCIQCTRCIRFGSQICGIDVIGTTGRGSDMLVTSYVDKMFLSELSGNIIDLCPVGALTAKPYMFKARPWEVRRANSIDVTDAVGSNIEVNYRFDRVLRVLPRENDDVNQEWLSDRGRWAIDSLEMQRLVSPMQRISGSLCEVEWDHALKTVACMIDNTELSKIALVAGPHCNVEVLVAAKDLMNILGSENVYIERGLCSVMSGGDLRAAYSMNVTFKQILQADAIILVGTNPRFEAPILNMWIRQAYISNETDIYAVGPCCEYNYHVNYLGETIDCLSCLGPIIDSAKRPLIFVGINHLNHANGATIMKVLGSMAACYYKPQDYWPLLNFIPLEASFCGALEVGYKPGAIEFLRENNPPLVISLGSDTVFYHWKPPISSHIVYIGFQGDIATQHATIVLPGSAYTESGGIYVNMETRSQFAYPAVTPPGKARYDWKIIRALAEYCGVCLFYSDSAALSCRLSQISPSLCVYGEHQQKMFTNLLHCLGHDMPADCSSLNVELKTLKDYYCGDVFSYNSPTMARAQRAAYEYECSTYAKN